MVEGTKNSKVRYKANVSYLELRDIFDRRPPTSGKIKPRGAEVGVREYTVLNHHIAIRSEDGEKFGIVAMNVEPRAEAERVRSYLEGLLNIQLTEVQHA